MKILPAMYTWTKQFPLNLGNHSSHQIMTIRNWKLHQ